MWDETVLIYGEATGDQFVVSVALSSDGTTLVVVCGGYAISTLP